MALTDNQQAGIQRINALLARGKFQEAAAACRLALEDSPAEPRLFLNLGLAFHGLGQMQQAAECFMHALQLNPDYTEASLQLGALLLQTGCRVQAAETYERLLQKEPGNVRALVGLGATCLQLGDPEGAADSCQKALAISPGNLAAVALAADIDEKQGRIEQAHARLQPLIRAGISQSGIVVAYAAVCRDMKRPGEAIAGLESLVGRGRPMSPMDRACIHFSLGELYDAAGEFDRAFAHYHEGNRLNYRGFDRQQPERDVQAMIGLYTPGYIAGMPQAGNKSQLPVFVVGMHRSGTSLVEQILASHPEIHGAGELPDITRILSGLGQETGAGCKYLECLPLLTTDHLDAINARHLERLAATAGEARRVIDKMPGNFMYLGFIRQAFPGARVIHCMRNPMDTCLSGYFQNFGGAQTYMNGLEDLGFVYRCYHRMMTHWSSVLKLPMLEMHYEHLVSQPEQSIRELLQFCGVEWDGRCLEFHSSGRYVNTVSYKQVRQPMYAHSVGRWKNYAEHLQPLREALGDLADP